MEFRAQKKSLFNSLLLDISPVITAGVIICVFYESTHWFLWLIGIFSVLFSLYLISQTFYVHSIRLYLDDNYIMSVSLSRTSLRWDEITESLLRERRNIMSRTDHLLILRSINGEMLVFNTSVLSLEDEKKVLKVVKEKTNLVIHQDKSSI